MHSTQGWKDGNPDGTIHGEPLSAAADKLDNFQLVAIFEANVRPDGTSNDVAISLHGNTICF